MKSKMLCLLLLIFTVNTRAQENFLQTVMVEIPDKTAAVSFEPQTVSPNSSFLTSSLQNLRQSAALSAENRVTRFLSDATNGVVFGYQITIEKLAAKQFRVSLTPLPSNFQPPSALLPKAMSLAGIRRATTLLTLPDALSSQILNEDDALTVDLLEHPSLGIKISDKIRVAANRERLAPPNLPRDFTVNDLRVAVTNLKLQLNSNEFELRKNHSGSLIWLHLPTKGFFLISLTPRDGYDFRKIGTIQNNEISFELRGDKYKLVSETPILPDNEKWFVWVLHDPQHQPFLIESPFNASQTAEEKLVKLDNPFKLDGSIAKPKDRTSLDSSQSELDVDLTASPPLDALKVRSGAVNEIQNVYPKN